MWLFSSKKNPSAIESAVISDISTKHTFCRHRCTDCENFLKYHKEEDGLKLSPSSVRVLKKTFLHPRRDTIYTRDFDSFVVSWNIENLPEPPDDIRPLLPPESWSEPDIICFGLQQCRPGTEPLWDIVITHSVNQYNPNFVPIANKKDNGSTSVELSGCLILLFVRAELVPFIHDVSQNSQELNENPDSIGAFRFGFHQSSICFVCGRLDDEKTLVDWHGEDVRPQRKGSGSVPIEEASEGDGFVCSSVESKNEDFLQQEMAKIWEAYARQKFRNMTAGLEFKISGNENKLKVADHPFIVWTGLKDYAEKSRLEAVGRTVDGEEEADGSEAQRKQRNTKLLNNHCLDVRYTAHTVVGPIGSENFTSSTDNLVQVNEGSVDVLKAGVMRLVLELTDQDGLQVPREASAELMLLRLSIPVVNEALMEAACEETLEALKLAEKSRLLPDVQIHPPAIVLERPLEPWRSRVVSFTLCNPDVDSKLPVPFQIQCLADSSKVYMPVNAARLRNSNDLKLPLEAMKNSCSLQSEDGVKSKAATVRSRPKKPKGWKKFAGMLATSRVTVSHTESPKGGGGLTVRLGDNVTPPKCQAEPTLTARASKKKGGNLLSSLLIGSATSGKSTSRSKRSGKQVLKESSSDEESSLSPALSTQNCKSEEASEVVRRPSKELDDRVSNSENVNQWLSVEPHEGVVFPGQSVNVKVQFMVQEGISQTIGNIDPAVIVVRVEDFNKDFLMAVEIPSMQPSFLGLSLDSLASRGEEALCPSLSEFPANSPGTALHSAPIPKEIWHLLTFIQAKRNAYEKNVYSPTSWNLSPHHSHEDGRFSLPMFLQRAAMGHDALLPQLKRDLNTVLQRVKSHRQIPREVSVDAALLAVELWALSLSKPLIRKEYIAEIWFASSPSRSDREISPPTSSLHLVCRATLLSLSVITRNFCLALTSLLRELLQEHGRQLHQLRTLCQQQHSADYDIERKMTFLVESLSIWVSRFLIRGTPSQLAVDFMKHLLQTDITR